jgi:23S rRNA pseudouridine2605 synthase
MKDLSMNEEDMRLQVFLAQSGIASRRAAAKLIEEGEVLVNGNIVIEPGFRVSNKDTIMYKNKAVKLEEKLIYLLFHKPKEVICSNNDPEGRPTVIDYIKHKISQRLFIVGRLDFKSTGLVLLTNDGSLAEKITHPRYEIEKEYEVTSQRALTLDQSKEFMNGIHYQGERYRAKTVKQIRPKHYHVILTEGKKNEIRQVFAYWKNSVRKLKRIRIANLKLENIKPGQFRKIQESELNDLMTLLEGK